MNPLIPIENKPIIITAFLVVATASYRVLVWRQILPPFLEHTLANTELSVSVAIALGLASVAAIAAGFAGAIIVFGISADSAIMRSFRAKTEHLLRPNWKSVIGSAFMSAILGLFCAYFLAADWIWLAAPALALGTLLLLHSIIRMIWLFGVLLSLVTTQDQKNVRKTRRRSTADVFRGAA
ncbi:hypothetical protein [Mycobacteroides abscessus]|uniref:hypothetical protein n=1 Tax=Mycobacteroides abscessus TaxID=36809 RepID=UPI000FEC21D5|nr:hypothetical protein [Mycobacteroides abscessus]